MTPTDLSGRLETFQALLASQRAALGDDHEDTLLTRQQIAYVTGRLGKGKRALILYNQVLADQVRVLGADHRDTLISRSGAAYYTGKTGAPGEALALYLAIAADSERVLGSDHRDTLIDRHQVAYYMMRTGRPEEALAVAADVLRRVEAHLDPGDGLVGAERWLHAQLALEIASASRRSLPRELAEAVRGRFQKT